MELPPENQCCCQHCDLDKVSLPIPADSLFHCGTQANYENYTNNQLSGWDTPEMVKNNLHYIVDSWLGKISTEDWEKLLQHYSYMDFNLRIRGWHKTPRFCNCTVDTLKQIGCQCGGV